ncbi:unnamed protein product [Closterium sp. NIES-54]
MPARELNSVRKLGTPSVSRATKAALRGTCTPRPPTPSVPLTKLLNRRGLTGAQLLLALATTKASTLRSCTSTSTTASSTSTTAAAASTTSATDATTSTAATEAPTPGTTPTSTATPSASSTASAAAPAAPSTTLAPLALAVAASPTRGRRSSDLLSANKVDSSSRSNRGEKGDRGTPLEKGDNIFQGQHSFANDEDDVDVAGEQPTEPAADMADEATLIPVTEQFGTPAYFPTNIDPHEVVQAQHDYASAEMHSPMNKDSNHDSSCDTFRDIPGDDDDVVEVTTTAETNLMSLRILGLVVAVWSNQQLVEPTTVRQALNGPDAEKWRAAMAAEVAALQRRGTWKLTFAPVGRHTSVRILLCIAAVKHRPLRKIDVSNAFLYAIVDAIIYVEQPHAFEEEGYAICLLQKSLYGIKQAPRLWQQHFHGILIELGFQQLPHDQGMYRLESRGHFILLVAYVDDLLYTGDDTDLLDRFEGEIQEKLEVTIDHEVTQFLGLNVTQTADTIHLSAAKYAETLAKKFGIAPVGVTTPFRIPPPNHELDTTPLSPADLRLYQQQLGCLLFAAVTCRPDLSYIASQLAQYLRRPEGENLADLRRALQYFISTPDVGLTYKANLMSECYVCLACSGVLNSEYSPI